MFHLCQGCPDKKNLLNFLESVFLENGYDMEDNTTYKQWISTDRSSLTPFNQQCRNLLTC